MKYRASLHRTEKEFKRIEPNQTNEMNDSHCISFQHPEKT